MLGGLKQNLVCTRTHGSHKRLSQTWLWVSECFPRRHGSAVACCRDRGSGCSRPGRCSVWAPPQSHGADNPQFGKQLHQRSSLTVVKVIGSTTDFSTRRSSKGSENSQGIWLWRPVGCDYRTSRVLGKETLGGHKQNLVPTRTQEKRTVAPKESEPNLPVTVQESLVEVWVDSVLPRDQGHWIQQSWHKSFWRSSQYPTIVWS